MPERGGKFDPYVGKGVTAVVEAGVLYVTAEEPVPIVVNDVLVGNAPTGDDRPRKRVRFTQHAVDRAGQMGVGLDDVAVVVDDPELDYPSPDKYPGCRIAARGEVAVAYDPSGPKPEVITVMPSASATGEPFTRPPLCPDCHGRGVVPCGCPVGRAGRKETP